MFADNSRAGSYAHGRAVNLILASGSESANLRECKRNWISMRSSDELLQLRWKPTRSLGSSANQPWTPPGQDAVHVTIVLTGGDRGLSGDVALDTIVAIRQSLQKDGDQRTPIINFTNEKELASDVSFESGPSL